LARPRSGPQQIHKDFELTLLLTSLAPAHKMPVPRQHPPILRSTKETNKG
jgi:hypothetical protein